MPLVLNQIEEEVVFLKSIKAMIDDMVNFAMLSVYGEDPDSSVLFETRENSRLFNITLVDLLSRTAKKAPVRQNSYLGALQAITTNPNFNVNDSVAELRDATTLFVDWLHEMIDVDIWMPSIDTQVSLRIQRFSFIKMCGNISKHDVLRIVDVAEELQQILLTSGVHVNTEEAMFALDEFYARFHEDIFNYHGSTIAEFLNNIRWGIYEYLQPEFRRSIVRDPDKIGYRYTYPVEVVSEFGKRCYWDIMNEVRDEPYVRRFKVTKYLKMHY